MVGRTRIIGGVAAAALALLGATDAHAAPARSAPPSASDRAAATTALEDVRAITSGRGGRDADLSVALLELDRTRDALPASRRAGAAAYFKRPSDGGSQPSDAANYAGETEARPYCTLRFCVHYVKGRNDPDRPSLTDADGSGTPDYVERMAKVFQEQVYACENTSAERACGLGADGKPTATSTAGRAWRAPKPDGTRGGSTNKIDVYIADIGKDGTYGYVAPDDGQSGAAKYAFQVMDNDYSPTQFEGSAGDAALKVTAAHEYNHMVQNAYDSDADAWMFEATATYFEDVVYPSINDYLQYIPDWAPLAAQRRPMALALSEDSTKAYATAVWSHYLARRYGDATLRRSWIESATPSRGGTRNFAPDAYGQAVAAEGGSFVDSFVDMAATMPEWRIPGVYPDDYRTDVARSGTLTSGGSTVTASLDHTTFRLYGVKVPSSATAPTMRLTVKLPAGLRGGVAIVGRTGGSATGGTVKKVVKVASSGGTATVDLPTPGRYGRITAVVANADARNDGYDDEDTGDWLWTKNAQRATLKVGTAG